MTRRSSGSWDGPRGVVFTICVIGIFVAAALFADNGIRAEFPWVNHDVSFITYAGQEIRGGARLYVDFHEVNPPGAQFLQAGLQALGDRLGAPEFLTSHLLVLGIGLAGLLVLAYALPRPEGSLTFVLASLGYLLLVVRGNFSNNTLPSAPGIPYDFGQREHLFVLLFLPYLLWRVSSRRTTIALFPFLIALGFVAMFKPYWPFLIAAVELYAVLRRKGMYGRIYLALGVGAILPYLILLLHSRESFVVFFRDVLPVHLRGLYAHYDTRFAEIALERYHVEMILGGVLFLALVGLAALERLLDRPKILLFAFLAVGAYASYFHQQKFWSYHGAVFFGVVLVLSCVLAARAIGGLIRGPWQLATGAICVTALAGCVLVSLVGTKTMLDRAPPKGHELVPLLRDRERVMFFSMSVIYSYAPVLLRTETVGPWRVHFEVPGLLSVPDPERRRRGLDGYGESIAVRIRETQPELLLFAPSVEALPPGYRLHDVLREHGAIPTAEYERLPGERLRSIQPLLRDWVVYRRTATGSGWSAAERRTMLAARWR